MGLMSSNRERRRQLDAKRAARRKKTEKELMEKYAAEGRIAYGEVIPEGAVAADLSKQAPNNSYSLPKTYYVDQPFECVDCGKEEVWTASQQKWYCEVAKGSVFGRAVRCRACRRRKRDEAEAQRQKSLPKS